MSTKTRSPRPKKQRDPEEIIDELREQLRVISLLPKNFRDIDPGSKEWQLYSDHIPGSREAMEKWRVGPILCLGQVPNPLEKEILTRNHKEVLYCLLEPNDCSLETFINALQNAEASGVSFIYLKGFPRDVGRAVNWLASFFKLRVRVKHGYVPEESAPASASA